MPDSIFDTLAEQAKRTNAPAAPRPNPVVESGRVGALPFQTPRQKSNARNAEPVYGALSNILALPNVPGAMIGAMLRDAARGRQVGGDQPHGAPTAEAHFLESLAKHPAQAVNDYFATSPQSVAEYAKGSGPLAGIGTYLHHHPRQNAVLDFFGRILDPGNLLTGEAAGAAGSAAKAATRSASRAAADAIVSRAPGMAASGVVKHLRTAEHLPSFNRFTNVRSAAEDLARGRQAAPAAVKTTGDAAEVAARNLANANTYAAGISQRAANDVFKGLTRNEQFEVVHMIEGDSPLMGDVSKLSPAQIALRQRLLPRVTKYRGWRARFDRATQQYGVADPNRMLNGEHYFSRAGMFADPENELGEEDLAQTDAFRERFRGGGGTTVRKGTLGENVHRKYSTLRQAVRAGAQLRPDVDPMQAFEMHAYTRTQAARINEQLDKLQDLGLIVPKESPVPLSAGVMRPNPKPPGYQDFLDTFGSLRQFGSGVTRHAYVDPSVAYLLQDVTASGTPSRNVLSSLLQMAGGGLTTANRALSSVEVANPIYHPLFNISQNIASEAPNVGDMIRGAANPHAVEQAEEAGVHLPFARRQPAGAWGRPWGDLSAQEKLSRLWMAVPHAVESFSAAPLYGHIEPRMATGAYAGLTKRLGPAGAHLAVRSIVGEPENLGAAERDIAPLAQFPAWLKSQLRRWPGAIAQRPQLYNAPHAAIRDVDLAKGRGPRAADESKILPPIVLGKDKNGDFITLAIPHPGNRATAVAAGISPFILEGDPKDLEFALAGAANPILQGQIFNQLEMSEQQKRDLAFVAPAPSAGQRVSDAFSNLGRFAPIRSLTSTELTPEHAAARRRIVNAFLYGHGGRSRVRGLVELRSDQNKAQRQGDTATADRLRKAGDALYQRMLEALSKGGFPAP